MLRFVAAFGQAIPNFWLGTMAILVFAVYLNALPAYGGGTWLHLVLPVLTLSFYFLSGLSRLTRSSMLENLRMEYVLFARTKGAPERRVLWRHAFGNAGVSVLTFSGLLLMNLLSGSVIVETVFAWPGVGFLAVESVQFRDFPVVQTIVILLAATYIILNLAIDLVYVALDPRLRVGT